MRNFLTMTFSVTRDRSEVTEIGLKSDGLQTGVFFGTGVIVACFHAAGTQEVVRLKLTILQSTGLK